MRSMLTIDQVCNLPILIIIVINCILHLSVLLVTAKIISSGGSSITIKLTNVLPCSGI